MHNDVNI